ncbi:hypothetical protein EJB05_31183 [Eragrostis curvula]|uniref:EXPERA domain-containing protein n=1 Tax=Eragrostis curvula TaxID=38414 RepID=A0A5J9UCX2_9POAL|nr:hypothetical protein EJB05_31183 [Eragrostis curvula]
MGEMVKQALLPATASKKDKQSWFPPMLVWSVPEVLKWVLRTAIVAAVAVGISDVTPTPCSQTSKFFQCPNLTPEQAVEANFFMDGFLWITMPQAAAAVVGLLLPHRCARSRWYLAFLAIVSATVSHYMVARGSFVFIAANPGDIAYDILTGGGSVYLLTADLLAILSLLVGGAE